MGLRVGVAMAPSAPMRILPSKGQYLARDEKGVPITFHGAQIVIDPDVDDRQYPWGIWIDAEDFRKAWVRDA